MTAAYKTDGYDKKCLVFCYLSTYGTLKSKTFYVKELFKFMLALDAIIRIHCWFVFQLSAKGSLRLLNGNFCAKSRHAPNMFRIASSTLK